ncbi:MAG: bifunctional UDP-N-acetylglucosamine diphosphorylase/glucosamine-1-phosphate N-acetyltransferase GlmU [Bacilli bacterium]|jgi:bifunctional UDP-N-acetylglucosamine pyrophosphorylase/glucosamine-1-phosphate N-acetyltransferase|nr:bifunctional UDP-N-acetylglucosamine diphosphorylase/glucosamine-1-phosphate N-acetyltransferase GlmU [Bacilli bacterium]
MKINAIILAAGRGTRMKSNLPKVIHKILDKPMIMHVIDNLRQAEVNNIISVVGYQAELVKAVVKEESRFVLQNEQLGTGHAIMMCSEILKDKDGITIVICGDTPLISSSTIKELIDYHIRNDNHATILTGELEDTLSYGKIIRDNDNNVVKIVEFKDAKEEYQNIKEFNTGTYIFNNKLLFNLIDMLDNNNSQKEYYLTDIIEIMANQKYKVDGCILKDLKETIGINDRATLAYAQRVLSSRINRRLMDNGITIIDPRTTYIGPDVCIEIDTIIKPNTHIYGNTKIGEKCIIGPNVELNNSIVLNDTEITNAHIDDCTIKSHVKVGPYARLRQNCIIEDDVKIGNFVEMKKTIFGNRSKSAHLSYLGDAIIGEDVNIGCGTITVNYDGKRKHQTVIEDNVFIGCNANLIAPIKIESDAIIAAGTTITNDVPKESLAIGRVRQEIKEDFGNKFK